MSPTFHRTKEPPVRAFLTPVRLGCAGALVASVTLSAAGTGAQATSMTAAPGLVRGASLPNTILVLVDDMRASDLRVLPRTLSWLARNGVRFSKAYAPTPLCCPARATILTGQYAHNTGVFDNQPGGIRPGGFKAFDDNRTLATRLSEQGIRTGYVGKYLNGYRHRFIPPGWDDWRVGIDDHYAYRPWTRDRRAGDSMGRAYEGTTTYNINGRIRTVKGYETTVQTKLATGFVRRNADDPFFLMLDYLAPHVEVYGRGAIGLPVPHQRHKHAFDGYQVPRSVAYNEKDMSDKPRRLRPPRMTAAVKGRIDRLAEARLETLQSVDDGMVAIRRALRRQGILDSTNVVFVSDNALSLGEHRITQGKVWAMSRRSAFRC